MSDLRHWSEEDATDEERELLREHRVRPDPARRRRIAAALGVGAAVTTTTAASASALGLAAKIVGVVAIGGAVAAGGYYATRPPAPPPAAPPPPVAVASTVFAPPPPVETAPPPPVVSVASAAPPPVSAPKKPPPAAPAASSLTREVATLGRARSALAAHDPDGAMRALDEYRAEFPNGKMASEETVLRVQVLMAKGQRAQAKALADSFVAQHPDSPFASQVQRLVAK